MALDKPSLINALKTAFESQYEGELSAEQEAGITTLSTDLANAIDAFVKTGSVNTPAGVPVQVAPATGTGATTAPGIGTIS